MSKAKKDFPRRRFLRAGASGIGLLAWALRSEISLSCAVAEQEVPDGAFTLAFKTDSSTMT